MNAEHQHPDDREPQSGAAPGDDPDDGGFGSLGLRRELTDVLAELGYEEPTAIQRESIPHLLAGRDLIGQAATGTGKTAAFALPLLDRMSAGRPRSAVSALVLVPTRELAMQVSEAMYRYGHGLGARVLPVYGGQHIGRQLDALRRGVDIVVATPGRALDHVRRGSLSLDDVCVVVLDEADEMLDMGFADELDELLDATPSERQTVLFSATMPPRIDKIARRHLREPVRIRTAEPEPEAHEAPRVRQDVYVVHRPHKTAALGRILDVEDPRAAIVFCRTRGEVDQLTESLNGRGFRAEALHGGMDQEQRDRVMGRLRSGTAELLVATDVAARGLDIEHLTHVINFDVPSAPEAYVHRIGRVGRAGREGVAITLAEPRERRLLDNIERLTGRPIGTASVPSVAELRARQLEQTREAVEESLGSDDLERFRPVLDRLVDAAEGDPQRVALAAIRLVHEANATGDDTVEIPDASAPRPARDRGDRGDRRDRGGARHLGDRDDAGGRRPPRQLSDTTATAKVHVNAGREARMRPNDLVGAIANETRLTGREIGAIRVADRYSVVEVPADAVDEVIAALNTTLLRGRKVTARRYTEQRR